LAGTFGLKNSQNLSLRLGKKIWPTVKFHSLTNTFQKSNDQKLGINSKFHENSHPKKIYLHKRNVIRYKLYSPRSDSCKTCSFSFISTTTTSAFLVRPENLAFNFQTLTSQSEKLQQLE